MYVVGGWRQSWGGALSLAGRSNPKSDFLFQRGFEEYSPAKLRVDPQKIIAGGRATLDGSECPYRRKNGAGAPSAALSGLPAEAFGWLLIV